MRRVESTKESLFVQPVPEHFELQFKPPAVSLTFQGFLGIKINPLTCLCREVQLVPDFRIGDWQHQI